MKSPRSPAARRNNARLDRHSGTGTRGLPKKNGAGGKTVWGSALDQAPVSYLDKNDPNYDSDKDAGEVPPDFELTPPKVGKQDDAPLAASPPDASDSANVPTSSGDPAGTNSDKAASSPSSASATAASSTTSD